MRKAKHKMTDDQVVIRILNLLQQQEKTGKDLEQALGLANGAVSKWKYLGIKSYKNYLNEIAEYLNVSVEELLKDDEKSELTLEEQRLIEIYRKMGTDEQRYLEQTLVYLLDSSELRKYKKIERGNELESNEKPLS